jgi:chromosome segregation ATPase
MKKRARAGRAKSRVSGGSKPDSKLPTVLSQLHDHAELTRVVAARLNNVEGSGRWLAARITELREVFEAQNKTIIRYDERLGELIGRFSQRLDEYRLELQRLERARGVLENRIKRMEDTRPAWAKDLHGNPLPVYTPPKPGDDD